jgi:hypothetical protein
MHQKGNSATLLPLNFSWTTAPQIDIPSSLNQLDVEYDAKSQEYLLHLPSNLVTFLTPPWDSTLPSLENFNVWWFDAKGDTLVRQLLPSGPWVKDAKLDKVLGRDLRNFSCGTDCYRHFAIKADGGKIFMTITGRTSAIGKDVLGMYRLSDDKRSWVKTAEGKPEAE